MSAISSIEQKKFRTVEPRLKQSPASISPRCHNYERRVQKILADRAGRKTWSLLEDLEKRAEHDLLAGRALLRLETLNACHEFGSSGSDGSCPRRLANLLDCSDSKTENEAWRKILGTSRFSENLPVLRASRKKSGWRLLGYPPCIGKRMGPSSRALESPENWNRLISAALRKRLRPTNHDPRLQEYRRLQEAHQKISSGKVRGRVSERALYLDMKVLEEELLPEQVEQAKSEARNRILGDSQHEGFQPESRVRRFLGAMSTLPESSRERHMFLELSRVATRDPRELRRYASHVLQELKRCDSSVSRRLMPDFRKALARVSRLRSEQKTDGRFLGPGHSFQSLLQALDGPNQGNSGRAGELQLYRNGLTVNGIQRDYTY